MKFILYFLMFLMNFEMIIANDNSETANALGKMALEGAFKEKVIIENLNLENRPYICMVNSFEFSAETFMVLEAQDDFLSISVIRHDKNKINQISISSVKFPVSDPAKIINELANHLNQILIDNDKKNEGIEIRGGEWLRFAGYAGGVKIHELIRSEGANPLMAKVQQYIVELIPESKELFNSKSR